MGSAASTTVREVVDQDRRRIYRVVPDEEDDLKAAAKTADGEHFAGEVLDVTIAGAGAQFPLVTGPILAMGEEVTLTFAGEAWDKLIQVRARAVSRFDKNAARRYGFEFDRSDRAQRRLAAEFHRLFTRRGVHRVSPDPRQPVDVRVRTIGGAQPPCLEPPSRGLCDHGVCGRLEDISGRGLAFSLDRNIDRALAFVDVVELVLCLPPDGGFLRLTGWIKIRRLDDDIAFYGVEFDRERSQHFRLQAEKIARYATHRRQAESRAIARRADS